MRRKNKRKLSYEPVTMSSVAQAASIQDLSLDSGLEESNHATGGISNTESWESLSNGVSECESKMKLPSMTEAYDSTVRPMIDVIDSMRRLGLDSDVSLPSITVIGDQSAGKSSVLEAISGVQLPRGKGIVTRCPIELRLRYTSDPEAWSARISYRVSGEDIEEAIESREHIGNRIRKAQNDLAGNDKGISRELVSLTIESNDVPDLTLVDLPGIARVAVGSQDKDVPTKIVGLIRERIKDQSAIILAVVPANVDIATTEALNWAKEFDPEGERTLGVITKPDLVDKGAEEEILGVVSNEVYPLAKGYTIVKCRGQLDIEHHVTLGAALAEEECFFQDHPKYSEIPVDQRGTRTLAVKLSLELKNHIKASLPRLEEDIKKKLKDAEAKSRHLSEAVPESDGDKIRYFLKVIEGFVTGIESAIHTPTPDMDADCHLFKEARGACAEFMRKIKLISPTKEKDGVSLSQSYLSNERKFRAQIEKDMEDFRSREIPTFQSYKVFEQTMKKQVKECKHPAMTCLETIRRRVLNVLNKLAEYHFSRFPKLCVYVKKEVHRIEDRRFQECKHKLEEHLTMEEMIFVQDESFLKSHAKTLSKDQKKKDAQQQQQQQQQYASPSNQPVEVTKHSPVEDMYQKMYSYMKNFRGRLSDTVPMIIIYNLLDKLHEEIKKEFGVFVADTRIVAMMAEAPHIQRQRKELNSKIQRLTKAEVKLANVKMEL